MNPPRILVAGIGNIFLGDDAFGVEVAQRLARRSLPEGVRVVDFGMLGSATVENDGTIRLHAAGGGECLVPARADGDAVRAALSSIQSQ